jgi:hypothetical protein
MIAVPNRAGAGEARPALGVALALAVLTAAAAPAEPRARAGDPPLPRAEDVLDRYVAVTGGKAAYAKLENQVIKGTVEVTGAGVKGSLTLYQAAPNKMYMVLELGGLGKVEEGTDGRVAWAKSALEGARIKRGAERAAALRDAELLGPLNWRKLYQKAECTGVEVVEGKRCDKVVLTAAGGDTMTQFYDRATGLLVKAAATHKTASGDLPWEEVFSEYKEVNGIRIAHRMRQKMLNQEVVVTVDKVEQNVRLPKGRFDLPEDVQRLAEKEKASPGRGPQAGQGGRPG